jgi:hypothetical protein
MFLKPSIMTEEYAKDQFDSWPSQKEIDTWDNDHKIIAHNSLMRIFKREPVSDEMVEYRERLKASIKPLNTQS